MRWESGRRSDNVEDRRGLSLGRGAIGGGAGALVIAVIAMLLGIDPRVVLQGSNQIALRAKHVDQSAIPESGADARMKDFVSVVLADTEDAWTAIFPRGKSTYDPPRLVLFSEVVRSACGNAESAVGPFYCPGDRKVYIDPSFYRDLSDKLGAPGDFAQAYVIAHEVGHHVQNLLGITEKVHLAQQRSDSVRANQLSVRMELQADCFAGIWAHDADRARGLLEAGDLQEALNAAAAIGDDRLQKRAQGYVVPETFTHGSSAQRVKWFRKGVETGSVKACDTFARPAG